MTLEDLFYLSSSPPPCDQNHERERARERERKREREREMALEIFSYFYLINQQQGRHSWTRHYQSQNFFKASLASLFVSLSPLSINYAFFSTLNKLIFLLAQAFPVRQKLKLSRTEFHHLFLYPLETILRSLHLLR